MGVRVLLFIFATKLNYMGCIDYDKDIDKEVDYDNKLKKEPNIEERKEEGFIYVLEEINEQIDIYNDTLEKTYSSKTISKYGSFEQANKEFIFSLSNILNEKISIEKKPIVYETKMKWEILFYKEISEDNKLSKEIIATYIIKI